MTTRDECEHGSLRRQCDRCDSSATIDEMAATIARLRASLKVQDDANDILTRRLSAAEAEARRLREAIELLANMTDGFAKAFAYKAREALATPAARASAHQAEEKEITAHADGDRACLRNPEVDDNLRGPCSAGQCFFPHCTPAEREVCRWTKTVYGYHCDHSMPVYAGIVPVTCLGCGRPVEVNHDEAK